jgi:hypothetical protein
VFYADQEQLSGGTGVGIAFGNTGNDSTNIVTYFMNINVVKKGWNFVPLFLGSAPPAGTQGYSLSVGGTGFDYTQPCRHIQFLVTSPQVGYTFHFDSLLIGRRSRSSFLVGLDSVEQGAIDYGLPELSAAGMTAYLAISALTTDVSAARVEYTALSSRVATLKSAGWACVNHSMSHVSGGYVTYTAQQIVDDWSANQQLFEEFGWFDGQDDLYRRFFAYPENKTNFNVEETLAGQGVVCARGIKNVYTISLDGELDRPLNVGSLALDNGTTLVVAINQVDEAIRRGATIHCFSHNLVDSAATTLNWNKDDFAALIDHVVMRRSQGLIDTPEWSDWYRGLTQPALVA